MISIAICEDSIPVQSQLEQYITEMVSDCPVEVFSGGEELLSYLSGGNISFSVYFMDISLPGISGIETAAAIREKDPYALIVYVTDYKEYVYQVFETLPYRFITKPVDKALFLTVLSDCLNDLESRRQMFCFHIERARYQIPYQEIIYFESRLRQVTLHTAKEQFSFYGKLNDIADRLDKMLFVRTHTSYVINMEYIRRVSDTEILLQTGALIPVSKKYRESLRIKHLEYMKWRTRQ